MLCSIGLTASYECEVKGAQLAHLPRHEVFGEHVKVTAGDGGKRLS